MTYLLIGSGNILTLGGGTLSITGKTASTNNQAFNGVSVNSGGGQILSANNSAMIVNNIALGILTATHSGGSLLLGAGGPNVTGFTMTTTTNKTRTPPATDTDRVRVYVPRRANTKLFGRLNVVVS